jgi:hypothetical protein
MYLILIVSFVVPHRPLGAGRGVLRGFSAYFPPGILCSIILRVFQAYFPRETACLPILRWNSVSFSARNGKM